MNAFKRPMGEKIDFEILETELLELLKIVSRAGLRSGMRWINSPASVYLRQERSIRRFQKNIAVAILHIRTFAVGIEIVRPVCKGRPGDAWFEAGTICAVHGLDRSHRIAQLHRIELRPKSIEVDIDHFAVAKAQGHKFVADKRSRAEIALFVNFIGIGGPAIPSHGGSSGPFERRMDSRIGSAIGFESVAPVGK